MRLQSQILQTLRAPEAQARLKPIVAQGACESRAAFGCEVCAQFGFVDARGTAQLTGCLKALEVLETERAIALPALRPHVHRPALRCLDAPVPAPVDVPPQVRDVEGLTLLVVEGRGAAPDMEHLARLRASAGHHHLRRLPGALSHRVGPWLAGRGEAGVVQNE